MEQMREHLKDISDIRNLMEQQSKFLSLSGLSGVSAGLVALLGTVAGWFFIGQPSDFGASGVDVPASDLVRFFVRVAFMVLVLALGFAVLFSLRMAKKRKLPVWNRSAKRMLVSLGIPLVVGAVFGMMQLTRMELAWVPATSLLFYGMALLNASKYTVPEIRLLAISELVIGWCCAAWYEYSLLFWGLGFGVLHVVYGIMMYFRYER